MATDETSKPPEGAALSVGESPLPIEELAAGVAGLEDLFRRRLLDDRDKRRAFDEMYVRLERAEAAMTVQPALPLIRDVIAVLDRIEQYEGPDGDFAQSVTDELLEALQRQGVSQAATPATADPKVTEIYEVVSRENITGPVVVAVHHHGYRNVDRIIRPALVSVAVPPSAAETVADTTVAAVDSFGDGE